MIRICADVEDDEIKEDGVNEREDDIVIEDYYLIDTLLKLSAPRLELFIQVIPSL